MDSDELDYQQQLQKFHLDIVKSLDLDRQYILSHLRSKFILDDEDCEIIKSGLSRKQQASKFIDILMTKGPKGFGFFIDGLEIEHPHLYETITGNKAVCQNPLPSSVTEKLSPSWKGGKDMFDQRILIQEMKKAAESSCTTLYMQERFLHEKKEMAQKLEDVEKELDEREQLIKDLKHALESKVNDCEREKLVRDIQAYAARANDLYRSNFDQNTKIIELQSKLLAVKDYIEQFRNTNESLLRKNETLKEQVRDLTINYDFQRTQSKRLSKQVDANHSELKQVAGARKDLLAVKYELARYKEERDEMSHNLELVTKKNLQLQASCKLLKHEKSSAEEGKGKVSVTLMKLEAAVKQLESNLNDEHSKTEMYKRRNERLLEEMDALKEQRDFYINERETAIEERDQVMHELDDCVRLKQEMQKSRDAAVQKQIKMVGKSEKKNSSLLKELERLNEQLEEMRLQKLLSAHTQFENKSFTQATTSRSNKKTHEVFNLDNFLNSPVDDKTSSLPKRTLVRGPAIDGIPINVSDFEDRSDPGTPPSEKHSDPETPPNERKSGPDTHLDKPVDTSLPTNNRMRGRSNAMSKIDKSSTLDERSSTWRCAADDRRRRKSAPALYQLFQDVKTEDFEECGKL